MCEMEREADRNRDPYRDRQPVGHRRLEDPLPHRTLCGVVQLRNRFGHIGVDDRAGGAHERHDDHRPLDPVFARTVRILRSDRVDCDRWEGVARV